MWGSYSENIAWKTKTAVEAVDGWMNSDSHRDNILGNQREVGFGVSGHVWVAVFGTSLEYLKEQRRKEKEKEKEASLSR